MIKRCRIYQGAGLIAFLIFLMFFPVVAGGDQNPSTVWNKGIIDQGAFGPGGIAIGDGRNNGIQRLYCASMNGDLVEYSWNGSGGWDKVTITVGTKYEGIVIGQGRNDPNNYLYCYKSKDLFELGWTGSAWIIPKVIFTSPVTQLDYVIIGPGRSDGQNRIYASNKRDEIYELYHPPGGPFELAPTMAFDMQATDIGIGHNDGNYHIYGVGLHPLDKAPNMYELTYTTGSPPWVKESIERWTSDDPTNYAEAYLLDATVGDGRGDGINRIYRTDDLSMIFEFTRMTGPTEWWGAGPIVAHGKAGYGSQLTEWGNSFAIGPRRSDPTRSRIYIGATDTTDFDSSRVYEFTYYTGPPCAVPEGCWERIEVGVQGAHGINVKLGELRGPGQIGIYAVTIEGHIVEFFEQ